jgi:palmitoyl-protein thioesterase
MNFALYFLVCIAFVISSSSGLHQGTPSFLVVWPGLGDACDSAGLTRLASSLEEIYNFNVHCIDHGHGGIYGDLQLHLADECQRLLSVLDQSSADPSPIVHYVGFSQGGLFLRVLIQQCDLPRGVLVTLGSPHAGVTSWPSCSVSGDSSWFCSVADSLVIEELGSMPFFQSRIVPTNYLYSGSFTAPFLVDANSCDGSSDKLSSKLENMVLFSFEMEDTLEPPETSHFGRWNGERVVSLRDQEELMACLGLKTLDEQGRLHEVVVPGMGHMDFSIEWFLSNVAEPYLIDDSLRTVSVHH